MTAQNYQPVAVNFTLPVDEIERVAAEAIAAHKKVWLLCCYTHDLTAEISCVVKGMQLNRKSEVVPRSRILS